MFWLDKIYKKFLVNGVKAYQIKTYGDLSGLVRTDLDEPVCSNDRVIVRVRACSLNFRDTVVIKGVYAGADKPALIPLSDGVGEVVEIGANVKEFKIGDRVAGTFFAEWVDGPIDRVAMNSARGGSIDGMLAHYVASPEHGLVHIPEHLSWEEAATLPCAGLTAWHALFERKALEKGQIVLTLGTGGVSIFALQFAKLIGARVIITSSHDDKLKRAKELGADEGINYQEVPDWDKRVFELTQKQGVDHVIEVGGAGTLAKSFRSARVGGHIELIGVLSTNASEVNPVPIFRNSLTVHGIYVGSKAMFKRMNAFIAKHQMRPIVDKVFEFDQTHEAYKMMSDAKHFGKLVIQLPAL